MRNNALAADRQGVRLRLFPQSPYLDASWPAEVVALSLPPGSVGAGPCDERCYVVDALDKRRPYASPRYLPPYQGAVYPPAVPDSDGHFDHLPVTSREFRAAHVYGAVRRTLDIWEAYLGRPIDWHFRERYPRLELIPHLQWNNAQSGYGFIELGYGLSEAGQRRLHSLNFDVLAHEVGHCIVFSEVGIPSCGGLSPAYRGFHESASDLVALVAVLHFDSVVDRVLARAAGNLYTLNELDRIGELSDTEQIRLACNSLRLSDLGEDCGDHGRSLPLTGALFDVLVELYQEILVEQGLIDRGLAEFSYGHPWDEAARTYIQSEFERAYRGRHQAFKAALSTARDWFGGWLAHAWSRLPADGLSYTTVASALLAAVQATGDARRYTIVRDSFRWREIRITGA